MKKTYKIRLPKDMEVVEKEILSETGELVINVKMKKYPIKNPFFHY